MSPVPCSAVLWRSQEEHRASLVGRWQFRCCCGPVLTTVCLESSGREPLPPRASCSVWNSCQAILKLSQNVSHNFCLLMLTLPSLTPQNILLSGLAAPPATPTHQVLSEHSMAPPAPMPMRQNPDTISLGWLPKELGPEQRVLLPGISLPSSVSRIDGDPTMWAKVPK